MHVTTLRQKASQSVALRGMGRRVIRFGLGVASLSVAKVSSFIKWDGNGRLAFAFLIFLIKAPGFSF